MNEFVTCVSRGSCSKPNHHHGSYVLYIAYNHAMLGQLLIGLVTIDSSIGPADYYATEYSSSRLLMVVNVVGYDALEKFNYLYNYQYNLLQSMC